MGINMDLHCRRFEADKYITMCAVPVNISLRFSRNSEKNTSEFEEMFP